MQNYKIIVQYNGTKYNGWQKQTNTYNTIQGILENVISKMVSTEITVDGSGRTDAGVHAIGQVANFKIETTMEDEEILEYINKYLPADIAVVSIEKVDERFHSRLNAKGKKYIYRIWRKKYSNVFEHNFTFQDTAELDMNAIHKASRYLVGEYDFKGFSSVKKTNKSTVRDIYNIEITENDEELTFSFHGNGFLHNMVRIMTGTLIEIGEGKKSPEDILKVLDTKDRTYAGFTAPPCGLTLIEVEY